MKAVLVARKTLLEILREVQLLGLEIAFPLVFLALTKVMYNMPLIATFNIWLYGPPSELKPLSQELSAPHYFDGRPVFNLIESDDLSAAEAALKDKSAAALLIVSSEGGFTLRGDAVSGPFYRASVLLESLLRRYAERRAGQAEIIRIRAEPVGGFAEAQSLFDLYAPGIITFAILMLIPQTAMLAAREIRWRTLRRLRLTRLSAGELLGGISLAQIAVAVLQVLVVFLGALALGFHNQGSLLLAVLVGVVLSISSIGMGLVVACFVENDSQAANIGGAVSMLQVFLSGSWFALPPLTVFTLLGHQIDLFDIFPTTSGFLALQQVLVYGADLRQIGFRLAFTLFLSGVYFALGVILFQRLQMRHP
jgi:ABC-2 type transport system permease protein